MGYRFELQHANIVAHLLEGNIDVFIDSLEDEKDVFVLNDFIQTNLRKNTFFSTKLYKNEFYNIIRGLEDILPHYLSNRDDKFIRQELEFKLYRFSKHIRRAKVKALLLPSFEKKFLSNVSILNEIVKLHPEDSCLILQTKPLENSKDIQLFNVFRGFKEALTHFDEFPGVLLWDDNDTLFIPVNDEADTIKIFERLLLNNRNPIETLSHYYSHKSKYRDYIYLLHLSDLHLGKVNHGRKQELLRLIDTHPIHKDDVPIIPIITGDLMETPSPVNKNKVDEFIDQLNTKSIHESIFVLGNHDIDASGVWSIARRKKQATINLVKSSQIEIFNEYNIIFIKFCSNQNGQFAQGEIGEEQFVEIAKELDKITNIDNYTLIALLHHHPIQIDKPSWYKGALYERVLSSIGLLKPMQKLIDADSFIDWCKERRVKLVLHGHKHIPNIKTIENITYIGAGSSTGNIEHQENHKTYISFNVIKYSLSEQKPTHATIYFEETIGTGTKFMSIEKL